jgi:hypothetical protein
MPPFFLPSAILEKRSSSSSASYRVNVLGEPLFLVNMLSVISSWKLCFFLCPDPNEYYVEEVFEEPLF